MRDMTDVKRCYERCFAGQAGQAVLDDLEARAFVRCTSFSPEPQRAAFNEGRRSLALHIRRKLDREDACGTQPGAGLPEQGEPLG